MCSVTMASEEYWTCFQDFETLFLMLGVQSGSFCGATHILITASQGLQQKRDVFHEIFLLLHWCLSIDCIWAAASLDVTDRVFQQVSKRWGGRGWDAR